MPFKCHDLSMNLIEKSFRRIVQKNTAFPEVAPEVKMSSENNSR
jgi:hypothetical protein